jgi:hypothetical protein
MGGSTGSNGSEGTPAEKPTILVSQSDTKRLLAIQAHIRQLVRTAMTPDKKSFKRPVEMSQAELVLASASLRALFFDHSPKPLLAGLLNDNGVKMEVETIETNLGLILLSVIVPEPGHISEHIVAGVFDPERKAALPLDKPTPGLIVFPNRKGFEEIMKRYKVWAPTRDQDAEINSGLTPFSNTGPMQLLTMTRRIVPLSEWGKVRIGYLKNVAITRYNLITYVSNRLGGVHYDSNRKPRNADEVEQFRVLASAMDWDDQSIMHAGLVGVGIACIEILNAPGIFDLYHSCCDLLAERQKRLIEKAEEAFREEPSGPSDSASISVEHGE